MASTSAQNKLPDAFDEIAPSTSSRRRKKLPYDVFINHRGPDVKDTLATTIHSTLVGMGLTVFLDSKELELGDFLPGALQEAMSSAALHIAIFSKRYAESPWCLAELAFMLKTGNPIVPIFYHVQPTDLRYVTKGVYADSFCRLEIKGRYSSEKLQEWKNALYNVSFNSGQIINNYDDEVSLLKKIVDRALEVIKDVPLVVAKHPVGMHEALQDFEMTTLRSAQLSNHNVQIVGIWGMGGSGKTTLAKEIYNNKWASMERSSFLFDIRDATSKSLLHNKQIKLLEDLGVKGLSFDNIEEGKGILARRLRSVRVFVILDDVDHVDQLDALLPAKDSLGSGSLIVVTTRELEVLKNWGISSIYKMKTLDLSHAEQLFCWHAFLQPSPRDGFEKFVKKFINVCGGLPLSLKVFGGQLYGNSSKDYWESLLNKLSRLLPHSDVKQSLKISYDALDDEEKDIFLDTACFFIGEEKSLAIAVWDGCGWSGLYSWEKLVNKCLVELDDMNRIRMHDHLRDLGREIASQQPSHRLWSPVQIINIQNQAKKRKDIRGIVATTAGSTSEVYEGICDLAASSPALKVFVTGRYFDQGIRKLVSRDLVWLRCNVTGQKNLSSSLSLKKLRILELNEEGREENHLEELWEADGDAPVQLRTLVISSCRKFQRFPESIGCLKDLKKLVVSSNRNLRSLPEEFCLLQLLEQLEFWYCSGLSELPSHFGDLTNLRHLHLSCCRNLRMLPGTFKQLTLVHHLNFHQCNNLTFNLDILENMRKLEYLNFSGCEKLKELPSHVTNQVSLRELHLGDTNASSYSGTMLSEIPSNIGELSKLRLMEIGSPLLTSLPTSLWNLSSLTQLSIWKSGVKDLPNSVTQLINLQTLNISESPIGELDFGQGPFTSSLCNLKNISLIGTEVSKISISEDCCPGLDNLTFQRNRHLREIEALPTTVKKIILKNCEMVKNIRSIGGLVNLRTLRIVDCPALDELPSFAIFASLQEFELRGCYKVGKIEGVEHCRSLEELIANSRCEVAGIESLEHMERLERLQLTTNKRSVVQSCIQTLQKWPSEIIICTRAACDAASLLNSFSFPNLSIVDVFSDHKFHFNGSSYVDCPSNADAIMLCLVINCVSSSIEFIIQCTNRGSYSRGLRVNGYYTTEVDEGKWLWIGVFTQLSPWLTSKFYFIAQRKNQEKNQVNGEVEKGLLVKGYKNSILHAFHKLLTILGNN